MGGCENVLVHAVSCSKGIGDIDTAVREKKIKGQDLKHPVLAATSLYS